jgi:hypothetical protein
MAEVGKMNPGGLPEDMKQADGDAMDAALSKFMEGDDEDELQGAPEEEREQEAEEADPVTQPEAEEAAEEGEGQPPQFSDFDYARALSALERDGWGTEDVQALSRDQVVRIGLKRDSVQKTVDGKFAEAARLKALLGETSPKEPNEGRPGTGDSAPAESSDPTAGADLASLAGPVVEAMEEGDTEKARAALVDLVTKASQPKPAGPDTALELLLADRAERRLSGRYEGDISKLRDLAANLGAIGRHADKQGLARFDALLEEALRIEDSEVKQNKTSTSRAPERRGARGPIASQPAKPKPATEREKQDDLIWAVLNGERDPSKLSSHMR